jgi:serine/threonine protein kinase
MSDSNLLSNRYRLEERQATGGMATIYRAYDLMLERTVAIKILRKDLSVTSEFRERFRLEAKAAANLTHPNIVTVHDFGLDADQLFIVMEYVPGTDLKTVLRQHGRFSVEEAVRLMIQACAGIGYAHRAGLVHCDIKPQNMLVTPDQQLKVVDFGIARALATISPDEKSEVVWGSPLYFSPEQARGGAPSPASDVYSLGVVLFEMLTGQTPFTASTPEELARMHRDALPPSPRKLNPVIPLNLEQVILMVLSKEPSARFRSADLMGQVLLNLVRPSPSLNGAPAIQQPQSVSSLPTHPAGLPKEPLGRDSSQLGHPARAAAPSAYSYGQTMGSTTPNASPGIDWFTWVLILLTVVAVGGLIPFWLWVYSILNSPL